MRRECCTSSRSSGEGRCINASEEDRGLGEWTDKIDALDPRNPKGDPGRLRVPGTVRSVPFGPPLDHVSSVTLALIVSVTAVSFSVFATSFSTFRNCASIFARSPVYASKALVNLARNHTQSALASPDPPTSAHIFVPITT
jgi:hypothetical protein